MFFTIILYLFFTSHAQAQPHTLHSTQFIPQQCTNNPPGPLTPRPNLYSTCPPLIDNHSAAKTGTWSPWAFPPTCITSKSSPGKSGKSKLCTFTTTSPWAGGALSMVTTPEIAASVVGSIHDPDIPWLEKEKGLTFETEYGHHDGEEGKGGKKQVGVEAAEKNTKKKKRKYEIKDMPGKGLGVVAKEGIGKDEVVMGGLPVLVQIMDSNGFDKTEVLKLLDKAAEQLPRREREELGALAKQGKRRHVVDDVVKTNSFGVTAGGVWHSGVYGEIARINHACKPNCFIRYSPKTLVQEVVAYKNIAPSEELTLSYNPLNILSPDRKNMLKYWGFTCTCPLCGDSRATAISDKNRQRVQDLLESLDHPGNHTHEHVVAVTAEMEQLAGREGLVAQMGDFYGIIADVYLKMGELELAKAYGEMAVELLRHYAGFDGERTAQVCKFLTRVGAEGKGLDSW